MLIGMNLIETKISGNPEPRELLYVSWTLMRERSYRLALTGRRIPNQPKRLRNGVLCR